MNYQKVRGSTPASLRKILLLIVLLIGSYQSKAQSRGVSNSASPDATQILMACVNDPGFANYYATAGQDAINMVDMPNDIQLSAGTTALGHTVSAATVEQARAGSISNYFTLGKVTSNNQGANVSLTYFYNHSNQGYKTVMVEFQLAESNGQYQITNANYTGDTL